MNKHNYKAPAFQVAVKALEEMNRTATPLPAQEYLGLVNYVEKYSERPLEDYGLDSVLHLACVRNAVELIDACLMRDAKSKVNTEAYGSYPLHKLVRSYSQDRPTRIKEIISHGADIHKGDNDGRSPLMVCINRPKHDWNREDDLPTLLISLGAFGKARDNLGMTELHHAVSNNQVNVVRALVDKGMSVNDATPFDLSPLHFAKTFKMISTLMEFGANVHAIDKSGRGMLADAMNPYIMGDDMCAEVLLKAGCGLSGVQWDSSATVHRFKNLWKRVGRKLELPHKTELLAGLLCDGGNMAIWAAKQLARTKMVATESGTSP